MNSPTQTVFLRSADHATDIAPLASRAAKEGVCLKPTRNRTRWFVGLASVSGEPVGICGLFEGTYKVFRLKGIYVLPEHRGKGFGASMTASLHYHAIKIGAERLEAITANPDFYLNRLGWDGKRPRGKKYWTVWKSIPVEKLVSRREYVSIG
ncbi:MAG: hypothetical protein GHCLOJNM_03083 [bacterium]|nr:hypothetical protein [bacterium]